MAEASSANKFADTTTLDGFFKRRFGKYLTLIPKQTKLQDAIEFSTENRLGEEYVQNVELGLEQGVTYAGPTEDAFDLAGSQSSVTKLAKLQGSQHVLQTVIGNKAAYSGINGEQAFANTTKSRVKNMWLSIHKRLEWDLIYGQDPYGLGVVDTAGYAADTPTSGQSTFTLTAASWSGIWAGMVNARVAVYAGISGANPGSVRDTSDGSSSGTVPKVVSVDFHNRKVVLNKNIASAAAGDVFLFAGAASSGAGGTGGQYAGGWKTMMGIHIMGTKSGTILNIDSSIYDQWKGVNISCGNGDFSYPLMNDGLAELYSKGGDGDVTLYVSPKTWSNMNSDQSVLRRYDASFTGSKFTQGAEKLEFHSINGKVTVEPHTFVKQGFAYAIMPEEFVRIGATDVTFDRAASQGVVSGQYFRDLTDKHGFELRCCDDQALFTETPAHIVVWTDIVNS